MSSAVSPELVSRPILAVGVGAVVFLILATAMVLILVEANAQRASRNAMETVFQAIPSGLAMYSPSGELTLWNQAFEQLMASFGAALRPGMSREEVMGLSLAGAARGSTEAIGFGAAFSDPMAGWEGELPDGRWLSVQRRTLPTGAIISIITDVTDRRRWEDGLRHARARAEAANQAKSDFLANMSHEIRTPLNGVLGMIQAMERDRLSPIQRRRLAVAHESGRALLVTLNDILDLAKVQAGRMELNVEPFSVPQLCEAACAAFTGAATVKGLSLDLVIEPAAVRWLSGDVMKIRQILANLLANAIKFTDRGGVRLAVTCEANTLILRAIDTGIGIDPAALGRIFDKFAQADSSTTRQFGGSGLGLAICRELTALMGGDISVESEPGRGATFTVKLPLLAAEAPDRAESPAEAETRAVDLEGRPLSVLVAEDNLANQTVLRTLLEPLNLELTVTSNGSEAVDAFSNTRFDLVLMDIQMPKMNGIDATRRMRSMELAASAAPTPIIALTANVMPDQLSSYSEAGMDDYVSKPIEVSRLYSVIARAVDAAEDVPAAA